MSLLGLFFPLTVYFLLPSVKKKKKAIQAQEGKDGEQQLTCLPTLACRVPSPLAICTRNHLEMLQCEPIGIVPTPKPPDF